MTPRTPSRSPGSALAVAVFAIGLVGIVALVWYRLAAPLETPPPVATILADTSGLQSGGSFIGDSSATIVMVEFSDFQCPFCAKQRVELEDLVRRNPSTVAVRFRHLPLRSIHPFAETAALVSECAAQQGRFAEYHDALYAHQQEIGKTSWQTFAERAGVASISQFDSCVVQQRLMEKVLADERDARRFALTSTPVVIIGKRLYKGFVDRDELAKVVRER